MKTPCPYIHNRIRNANATRWRVYEWLPKPTTVSTQAVAKALNITPQQASSQLSQLAKGDLVVRANGGWRRA